MVDSSPETILSCDWGTTNVRLRRAEVASGRILSEASDERGVKALYAEWRSSGGDRAAHYLRALESLLDAIGRSTTDRALVLSGMVSSSIGMIELPYADVPFRLDGADLSYRALEASRLGLPVLLLSGVRTRDDVMRGEETELIGLGGSLGEAAASSTFILPGTHSKHVYVEDDVVRDFRTYMTGEAFEVMGRGSILRETIERGPFDRPAFDHGVRASSDRPLLAALFSVRTNALFERLGPTANYWYLSGLLIGSELQDASAGTVVVCGMSRFSPIYRAALEALGAADRVVFISPDRVDRAAVDGHLQAYRRLLA